MRILTIGNAHACAFLLVAAVVAFAVVGCHRNADDSGMPRPTIRVMKATATTGRVLWHKTLDDMLVLSLPVGADGTLFVGAGSRIRAMSGATGEFLWSTPDGSYGNPHTAVADNIVVAGCIEFGPNFKIVALRANDGAVLWQQDTDASTSTPVINAEGQVYAASTSGTLYAFQLQTGKVQWTFHSSSAVMTSPAVGGLGDVFLGSQNGTVYSLSGTSGKEKWRFHCSAPIDTSPVATPSAVYVSSRDGNIYAVNSADGSRRWTMQIGGRQSAFITVDRNGTVFTGSWDGVLYALDAHTGAVKWRFRTQKRKPLSVPSVASDSTVYVGSADGNVYAVDSRSGKERWHVRVGRYVSFSPSIGPDGTVYAISRRDLFAIH